MGRNRRMTYARTRPYPAAMTDRSIDARVATADWAAVCAALDEQGYARLPGLLTPQECAALAAMHGDEERFRSRVVMERIAFGRGDYAYFAYPLPGIVAELRAALYPWLVPVAEGMERRLGRAPDFPNTLDRYLARCHDAGQTRPTPLLLHYTIDGYNRLHRDLYGELHFPLQVVVMLSRRAVDYDGGEFLLVENRPRQQSVGTAVAADQGEAVIFPVFERPVRGKRGWMRAQMRHGVSRVTHGERFALGVIFHDAA